MSTYSGRLSGSKAFHRAVAVAELGKAAQLMDVYLGYEVPWCLGVLRRGLGMRLATRQEQVLNVNKELQTSYFSYQWFSLSQRKVQRTLFQFMPSKHDFGLL